MSQVCFPGETTRALGQRNDAVVEILLLICDLFLDGSPQGVATDAKELYGVVKDLVGADYAKDKVRISACQDIVWFACCMDEGAVYCLNAPLPLLLTVLLSLPPTGELHGVSEPPGFSRKVSQR